MSGEFLTFETLEKSLYEFVGRELSEVAWKVNLPIHPAIGLNGFFNAFLDKGIEIKHDSRNREALFVIPFNNGLFESTLTYEEIKQGWGNYPKDSPKSYYDSICKVYDKAERSINLSIDGSLWFEMRNADSKVVCRYMEEYWKPYFNEHHENMFLPYSRKEPELVKPRLFDLVMRSYPLDHHSQFHSWDVDSEMISGPCAEYIPDTPFENYDEEYHPSDNAMTEYFWGLYLYNFAKNKKYPFKLKTKNKKRILKSLILSKHEALIDGIHWESTK